MKWWASVNSCKVQKRVQSVSEFTKVWSSILPNIIHLLQTSSSRSILIFLKVIAYNSNIIYNTYIIYNTNIAYTTTHYLQK